MGGTGSGCLRQRFGFLVRGFAERFGSRRCTLDRAGRVGGRKRRRLRWGCYRSFLWGVRRRRLPQTAPKLQRNLVVQGAGVRLLVRDSQLRQQLEEHIWFYFELASQLIDANFTHTGRPSANCFAPGFQPLNLSFSEPTPSYRGSGDSVFFILTDSFSGSVDKISTAGSPAAASGEAAASAVLSPAGAGSDGGSPAEVSSEPSNWP
jgi:hypothetical protein